MKTESRAPTAQTKWPRTAAQYVAGAQQALFHIQEHIDCIDVGRMDLGQAKQLLIYCRNEADAAIRECGGIGETLGTGSNSESAAEPVTICASAGSNPATPTTGARRAAKTFAIFVAEEYAGNPGDDWCDKMAEIIDRETGCSAMAEALKAAAPYLEFYAEREMASPSNNQEAVRETREMLSKFRLALEKAGQTL